MFVKNGISLLKPSVPQSVQYLSNRGRSSIHHKLNVCEMFFLSVSLQKLVPISQITNQVFVWIRGLLLCSFFRGKMNSQTNWWPADSGKAQPSSSPCWPLWASFPWELCSPGLFLLFELQRFGIKISSHLQKGRKPYTNEHTHTHYL